MAPVDSEDGVDLSGDVHGQSVKAPLKTAQLPPLNTSSPSPPAVDKLVAAALIDIVKSTDELGHHATTLQEKQGSVVSDVAKALEAFGMQRAAKELGALKKEVMGFERTIDDMVSKPLAVPLKSQISEVNVQQNKLVSMQSQKAEVISKSEKACASLNSQRAELEKQIRNWNRREGERTDLPKRLEEELEALQKELALNGKSEAWQAVEANEKRSKSITKTLKRDHATILELEEQIFNINGIRLKTLDDLNTFLAEGFEKRYQKIVNECAEVRRKLQMAQEAREKRSMECEDLRVRYSKLEEQGWSSLRTSLERVTQIRELAGQKKELTHSLSTKRMEVAARRAELAYTGWWKGQLEIERKQLQQRIIDSSPDVVGENIKKQRDSIQEYSQSTDVIIEKAKASLLKQEIHFHKRENHVKRILAAQSRLFFETQWQEIQAMEREVTLENLVAGDIEMQAAKEAVIASLRQNLLRLISAGDNKEDLEKLQIQLKELSSSTLRVESHMTLLERCERMIAAADSNSPQS